MQHNTTAFRACLIKKQGAQSYSAPPRLPGVQCIAISVSACLSVGTSVLSAHLSQ